MPHRVKRSRVEACLPRLMDRSDWGDGSVAIGHYVRQSGNHYCNRDNQCDGLTPGIRKHELVNTNHTVKLRRILLIRGIACRQRNSARNNVGNDLPGVGLGKFYDALSLPTLYSVW
jgi:hypothetical protein